MTTTVATHTPGPFMKGRIARGKYINHIGIYPPDSMAPAIALLPYGPNARRDIQDANANLFVAAPDLLAACEAFRDWANGGCRPIKLHQVTLLVDAAIAKARINA